MASRKIFFGSKPNYIYPTMGFNDANLINNNNHPSSDHHHHHLFEFDEADVWNSNNNDSATAMDAAKKPLPISRTSSKKLLRKMEATDRRQMGSASLPVNIPDWNWKDFERKRLASC
ncbi:Senescence regulator [Corchorus capsularis]|uniref:Senescence regulator n=1 Tax=Corchorus capsularis TaxID=210143 RepID=A0A1R3HQ35_COCAP|nr:Senescence regulator [Corchorus capsularis]